MAPPTVSSPDVLCSLAVHGADWYSLESRVDSRSGKVGISSSTVAYGCVCVCVRVCVSECIEVHVHVRNNISNFYNPKYSPKKPWIGQLKEQ